MTTLSDMSMTMRMVVGAISLVASVVAVDHFIFNNNAMAQAAIERSVENMTLIEENEDAIDDIDSRLILVEERLSQVQLQVGSLETAIRTNSAITTSSSIQNAKMLQRLDQLLDRDE